MPICYPNSTDWSCLSEEEFDSMDPTTRSRAEALAWSSLVRLTGQRLSICPVVLRPCAASCDPAGGHGGFGYYGGSYAPYISGGTWYNACGCTNSCECDGMRSIRLVGEVSGPLTVTIDGGTLEASAYRVDGGNLLVRMDGGEWPLAQDMTKPDGEVGTFSISYFPGMGPDAHLNYAAGILALEWYKACTNNAGCRLPVSVTQVTRQGVSFSLPSGVFEDGLSGIREVDAITGMYNPNRLKVPTRILSPDSSRGRQRTA